MTYAAERHITVIPEIEFPAHSDAVFIGYPELCCTGKPYTTGEFCVGNEQVYTFMEDVLTEVMELFPSKYIHIGGDEARKVAWATCPKCQALIERERLDGIQGLQPYMIARIQDFLASKGRVMVGWDEILHNELHSETLVMSYRGQKGAIEAANRGNYAVMTPGEVLYFDWYQADPSTQPRAMYGYSPIKSRCRLIRNRRPATSRSSGPNSWTLRPWSRSGRIAPTASSVCRDVRGLNISKMKSNRNT